MVERLAAPPLLPSFRRWVRWLRRGGAVVGVGSVIAAGAYTGSAYLAQSWPFGVTHGGGAEPGTANIFVATTGNDSTCDRSASLILYANAGGSPNHICATPQKACEVATQSGDKIIVEDGSYSVSFESCRGHESYAQNIVFEPEPGHECPMSYPNIPDTSVRCDVSFVPITDSNMFKGANGDTTCGVTGNPLPSTLSDAQRSTWINHITIQGIFIEYMEPTCAAYITLKDDAGGSFLMRQGTYHWLIDGGDFNYMSDGSYTPSGYIDALNPSVGDTTNLGGSYPPAENITIRNALVRDIISVGPEHGDGYFIKPSYDVHIIKNIIVRNDCIPFYVNFDVDSASGVQGLWIIGNEIHIDTQHVVGDTRCNQTLSLGERSAHDSVIAFNSIEGPIERKNPASGATMANNLIVGNVAEQSVNPDGGANCFTGYSYAYNVWYGGGATDCGSDTTFGSDTQQFTSYDTAGWTGTPGDSWYEVTQPGDYALQAGVAAIDKVPTSWCSTDSVTTAVCAALSTDIDGNPRPTPGAGVYWDAGAYENR